MRVGERDRETVLVAAVFGRALNWILAAYDRSSRVDFPFCRAGIMNGRSTAHHSTDIPLLKFGVPDEVRSGESAWGDGNSTLVALAAAVGLHVRMFLQGKVDDPALVGRHWFEIDRALAAANLTGDPFGQSNEGLLAPVTITFDIDDDTGPDIDFTVDEHRHQILDLREVIASAADQHTQILPEDINEDRLRFVGAESDGRWIVDGHDLGPYTHVTEQLAHDILGDLLVCGIDSFGIVGLWWCSTLRRTIARTTPTGKPVAIAVVTPRSRDTIGSLAVPGRSLMLKPIRGFWRTLGWLRGVALGGNANEGLGIFIRSSVGEDIDIDSIDSELKFFQRQANCLFNGVGRYFYAGSRHVRFDLFSNAATVSGSLPGDQARPLGRRCFLRAFVARTGVDGAFPLPFALARTGSPLVVPLLRDFALNLVAESTRCW